MPVPLKYRIPKNISKTIANQIAAFSSLALDQGELEKLKLRIVEGGVTEQPTYLERNLTLTELVPDFVDTYGPLENPATWGLESLFSGRIETALNTRLLPNSP